MTEERFEEFVKRTLDELDPVPAVPREEMWARIQEQRRFARRTRRHGRRRTWFGLGAGLAAMLALGIGIGRYSSAPGPETSSMAAAPAPVNSTAYTLAVADHMTRAEALLTSFRTQPHGELDPQIAAMARELLTTTRLLLDSPAAEDARTAKLLEDLELITAQIAQLSRPSSVENEIIKEGMEKTAVLPRLRARPAAGPAAAGT